MDTIILFVLGTVVGSFLNVLALRYPKLPMARSACPKCGTRLQWFELVPFLSFLALGGSCRTCRAKISLQYPMVELWTGLVFVTVPLLFIPVFCLYITIAIYDWHHKIIPDGFVYPAILLSIVGGGWLAGLILFAFFASIWLLSRGKAMGFGDAKLGASIGFLLGAPLALSGIILAFWIGALYGITLMLFGRKNITIKSEVPLAPFMVLGAWLSLIFQLDLLQIAALF